MEPSELYNSEVQKSELQNSELRTTEVRRQNNRTTELQNADVVHTSVCVKFLEKERAS